MNDATPPGNQPTTGDDTRLYQPGGTIPVNISGRAESGGSHGSDLDPIIAGAQDAITTLTSQVNRAYEELVQRDQQLKRREDEARATEARAAKLLSDAQSDAQELLSNAERESQQLRDQMRREHEELIEQAEGEAAHIVARAHSIEGQIAQRLAEMGRRDQELGERESQLNETAQHQQAEREWLNEYAQRLTGIASDLERALGDAGSHAAG